MADTFAAAQEDDAICRQGTEHVSCKRSSSSSKGRWDRQYHGMTDAQRSDSRPPVKCKGVFVSGPCPRDADKTAWYALGLALIFVAWGGVLYWFQSYGR